MKEGTEQAFVLHLKLSDEKYGDIAEREAVYAIENDIGDAVARERVGEYDGHEFGGGYARLYIYGPNAETLAAIAVPIVQRRRLAAGSYGVKRYGTPGSREIRISLTSTAYYAAAPDGGRFVVVASTI
jgi:hypothetical protein